MSNKIHRLLKPFKTDALLSVTAAVIVFISVLSTLNYDCAWGDDFAAYINQGIAIASGKFEAQVEINAFMHPSPLPDEALGTDLVYVWGYPLILALVYKLVGFDTAGFSSMLFYKLPSLLALSLMAALMYWFFRGRFKKPTSFILCILLCLHTSYVTAVSSVYSDIVFILLSWLCFFLAERLVEKREGIPACLIGILLGFCMWGCCAVRLNGVSVIAIAAFIQLAAMIKDRRLRRPSALGIQLIPYLLFAALRLVFDYLVFMPATSNLSDLGSITLPAFLHNIYYYAKEINRFLFDLPGVFFPYSFWKFTIIAFTPFLAVGLWRSFRREFPYILFLAGTLAVLLLLPYAQGSRYCFSIFPVLLLILGYCAEWLWELAAGHLKNGGLKALRTAAFAACILLVSAAVTGAFSDDFIRVLQGEDVRGADSSTAYSQPAVEAYRYIQGNTAPDSLLAFEKPRALYLNTGRLSFRPDINGHRLEDADYYLSCNYFDEQRPEGAGAGCTLTPVWSNGDFSLFSVSPLS